MIHWTSNVSVSSPTLSVLIISIFIGYAISTLSIAKNARAHDWCLVLFLRALRLVVFLP